MKKIFLVAICIFLLVNLAACMTETPTGEPVAEIPFTAIPGESVEPVKTPDPTPIPPLVETPDGYDENGIPYYSVEENPDMIYDPYYAAGSYLGVLIPFSTDANSMLEMAGDASSLDPDSLPVIRKQFYNFNDKITQQQVYTVRTPAMIAANKSRAKQRALAANSFTGLRLTESSVKFEAEDSPVIHYTTQNANFGFDQDGMSIRFNNYTFHRTMEEAVDGKTFLDEAKNNPYISGLIELAGYQNPVCKRKISYSTQGISGLSYFIYDETDDPVQNQINLNFHYISIFFDQTDNNETPYIVLHDPEFNENTVKEYPAISYQEAKQLLLEGEYFTNVPYEVIEEDIEYTDLTFITDFNERYYVPVYRFFVNTHDDYSKSDLEAWGMYYVPAVTGLNFQLRDEFF